MNGSTLRTGPMGPRVGVRPSPRPGTSTSSEPVVFAPGPRTDGLSTVVGGPGAFGTRPIANQSMRATRPTQPKGDLGAGAPDDGDMGDRGKSSSQSKQWREFCGPSHRAELAGATVAGGTVGLLSAGPPGLLVGAGLGATGSVVKEATVIAVTKAQDSRVCNRGLSNLCDPGLSDLLW